jgi:hypothetical protein
VPPPSVFPADSVAHAAEFDPTFLRKSPRFGSGYYVRGWSLECYVECEQCHEKAVKFRGGWDPGDQHSFWYSSRQLGASTADPTYRRFLPYLIYREYCSVACGIAIGRERRELQLARQAYQKLRRLLRTPAWRRHLSMLGEIPFLDHWPRAALRLERLPTQ